MAAYNAVVYAAATYGTGNAAKRMRLSEEPAKPSRVLHLRGLPQDTTEAEITTLTTLFGVATNIILTRQKNQALVEMSDLSTAQQMVDYYKNMPARIRSQPIHVQFSMHERLKNAAQPLTGALGDGDSPNTILRVIVDNMLYAITLETLHMLFSKYGRVLRIITFSKNNSFQALIEYQDALSAQAAKVALNGQNVYNGCCALHIDFSKLKKLSVRYNNDKSRDFTNPQLASDECPGNNPAGAGVWGPYPGPGYNMDSGNNMFGFYPGAGGGNMMHPQFGYQGMPMGGGGQMPFMSGGPPFMPPGPPLPLNPPSSAAAAHHVPPGSGSVVLVSNLDPERITPDALFALFGVYGDVVRVKILFNKKDTALIQFVDAAQAQRALTNLDYITLHGKQIKVTASKHSTVQMPKEGTVGAELTQDYANSDYHRFRNPDSNNHLHIHPPSATLHISNLPTTKSESDVRALFSQHGNVVNFKYFEKNNKMGLIEMESLESAIEALSFLHNYDLGGTCLRVSFTKNTIGAI